MIREADIMAFSPLTYAPWGVTVREPEVEVFGPTTYIKKTFFLISLIISLKIERTFHDHFSDFPSRHLPVIVVHKLDLNVWVYNDGFADGIHIDFFGAVPAGGDLGTLRHTEDIDKMNTEGIDAPLDEFRPDLLPARCDDLE